MGGTRTWLCWPCARTRLAAGALRLRTPAERAGTRDFRSVAADLVAELEDAVAAYEEREWEIAKAQERWEQAYRKKREFQGYQKRYEQWLSRCVRIHEDWEDYSRAEAALARSRRCVMRFAPRPPTPAPVLRHILCSGS